MKPSEFCVLHVGNLAPLAVGRAEDCAIGCGGRARRIILTDVVGPAATFAALRASRRDLPVVLARKATQVAFNALFGSVAAGVVIDGVEFSPLVTLTYTPPNVAAPAAAPWAGDKGVYLGRPGAAYWRGAVVVDTGRLLTVALGQLGNAGAAGDRAAALGVGSEVSVCGGGEGDARVGRVVGREPADGLGWHALVIDFDTPAAAGQEAPA